MSEAIHMILRMVDDLQRDDERVQARVTELEANWDSIANDRIRVQERAEAAEARVTELEAIVNPRVGPTGGLSRSHGGTGFPVEVARAALDRLEAQRKYWEDAFLAQKMALRRATDPDNRGLEAAEADVARLREALTVYADGRNWAISRDDLALPVTAWVGPAWVGPGAVTKRGVPDAPAVARAALAAPTKEGK